MDETKMIAAHKRGIADYSTDKNGDMQSRIRHARRLYDVESEREAYLAGYIGAQKRARAREVS